MSLEYKLMTADEALDLGIIDYRPYKYAECVIAVEDGKYRFVGSDGGEPVDASLGRDFSWVLEELNLVARRLEDPPAYLGAHGAT